MTHKFTALYLEVIFLVSFSFKIKLISVECPLKTNLYFKDRLTVIFNFDDFSELNFTNCEPIKSQGLKIQPNKQLILDEKLDFKDLTIYGLEFPFLIVLQNLKGFDVDSNPFATIHILNVTTKKKLHLEYVYKKTTFDFYYKNQLITHSNCNSTLLSVKKNHFSETTYIMEFLSTDIIFHELLCPLVFFKSRVFDLNFQFINSLIIKNLITFASYQNFQQKSDLDSGVFILDLQLYRVAINEKLLNRYVYYRMKYLTLNGIFFFPETNIFELFENLKMLRIRTQFLRNVFQRNNKWLQGLNPKVYFDIYSSPFVNVKDVLMLILHQSHPDLVFYDFPQEDFCYFRFFPHNKLVMPTMKPYPQNVSCLYIFLIQFANNYPELIKYNIEMLPHDGYLDPYYVPKSFSYKFPYHDQLIYYCDDVIKKLNSNCEIHTASKDSTKFYFYIFDWKILIQYNDYIFSMFITPLLCVLSFVVNLISIILLSSKKIKDSKIYSYLKLNYLFIVVHTSLSFFKLFYACVSGHFRMSFCFTDFSETLYARYFYIIVIRFIRNSLKTCANISYACFTLGRYIAITESNNRLLLKFKKLPFNYGVLITILLSSLINLHSYFQFSTTVHPEFPADNKFYSNNQANKYYALYSNYFAINDYTQELDFSKLTILVLLNIINIIFSDIFFIVLSVLIDFFLFTFIKKKNMLKHKNNLTSTRGMSKYMQIKKLKQERRIQNRISSMIILNSGNFIFLRMPSLIVSFYGFVFRYDTVTWQKLPNFISFYICRRQNFCKLLSDIAFCFYLLSYVVQFFVFYKLDRNFRMSLRSLFHRKNISNKP